MTFFVKSGSAYAVSNHTDVASRLPPSTFMVMVDPRGNFFLEEVDSLFPGTSVLYGDVEKRADRVMRTFNDRGAGTGILLSGNKGSGKSMFARLLSLRMSVEGNPTIMVTRNYTEDEGFMSLLKSIKQPYMLFIDEFEKTFNADRHQIELLSLLDGSDSSKRLTVITTNSSDSINDYMRNRPGRFYYHFRYDGLEEEFVREYCEANLVDKSGVEDVVKISNNIGDFNFDVLKALVEEMNRYGESASDASRYLNIEIGGSATYEVVDFTYFNDEFAADSAQIQYRADVLKPFYIDFINDQGDEKTHQVNPEKDLVSWTNGEFKFKNKNFELTVVKKKAGAKKFSFL